MNATRCAQNSDLMQAKEADGGDAASLMFVIDKKLVQQRVGSLLKRQDLSKFIL